MRKYVWYIDDTSEWSKHEDYILEGWYWIDEIDHIHGPFKEEYEAEKALEIWCKHNFPAR